MEIFKDVFFFFLIFYRLFSQELRANNVTSARSQQQQSSDVLLRLGAVISGVCSVLAHKRKKHIKKSQQKSLKLNDRANNVKLFRFSLKVESCPVFGHHGRDVQ